MVQCSPHQKGHVIRSGCISSDQRAHGLCADLTNGSEQQEVLTRQPLSEPSLPKPLGKSH